MTDTKKIEQDDIFYIADDGPDEHTMAFFRKPGEAELHGWVCSCGYDEETWKEEKDNDRGRVQGALADQDRAV